MRRRLGHVVVEVVPRFWTNTWRHPVYNPPEGIEMYVVDNGTFIAVDVEVALEKRKIVLRFRDGVFAPFGVDLWDAITRIAEGIDRVAEKESPESEIVLVEIPREVFDPDDLKIKYLQGGDDL